MGWWTNHDGRGHGRHEHFAGFGGGFGRGRGGWGERFEHRGRPLDERFVLTLVLEALREAPGNGYDVVQTLERKLDGTHAVGPALVYPALRLAEDAGFVTGSKAEGDRPVYALTEAGHMHLAQAEEQLDAFWKRVAAADYGRELHGLFHDARGLVHQLKAGLRDGQLDDAAMARIKAAIAAARQALREDQAV